MTIQVDYFWQMSRKLKDMQQIILAYFADFVIICALKFLGIL